MLIWGFLFLQAPLSYTLALMACGPVLYLGDSVFLSPPLLHHGSEAQGDSVSNLGDSIFLSPPDLKSGAEGKSVDLGGRRVIKKISPPH